MTQPHRLQRATILIVENEALIRCEVSDWLADRGLLVLTAEDGDEAVALLDTQQGIDVLMTDIVMPGSMSGLRLAHHARKRWPSIRIVVVSGRLDIQLADLPSKGVFVPKPFEPEALWRALFCTTRQRGSKTPALKAS